MAEIEKRINEAIESGTAIEGINAEDIEMQYTQNIENGHDKVTDMPPVISVNNELGINGKIDEPVIQSRETGSCWLLSGIDALNSTEKGKQIIRNSIIPKEDGTITVNYAGANRKITITPDEINAHNTDNNLIDEYSNGYNDMLVFELATEKLKKERPDMFLNPDGGISGGYSEELWKALIPNYNIEVFEGNKMNAQVHDTLEKALNNKNLAVGFALNWGHQAKLIDGSQYEFDMGNHALAITNVKENEVTFKDPYNGAYYTMTWDEFEKLNPKSIYSIDLTDA